MSDLDHLWHVWINRRQDQRGREKEWEHSLYEFKSMLNFLSYGAKQIQEAFEGKLPQTHQQCSHQPVEQLKVLNVLKCSAEGVDVTKCPILLHLREVFTQESERIRPFDGKKSYDLPAESVYDLMAKTCAWHIYTTAVGVQEGKFFIDTSEGYLTDETDRMFWSRVHENLSYFGDDEA